MAVARKLSFISEAAACVKLFNGARRMAEARKLPVISEATHRLSKVTHRKEDALTSSQFLSDGCVRGGFRPLRAPRTLRPAGCLEFG